MNRLLSIVVTLFVLFLFYIWINHLVSDDFQSVESPLAQKSTAIKSESLSPPEPTVPAPSSKKEPKNIQPTGKVTKNTSAAPSQKVDAKAPDNGVHYVVAGNFLNKANADKMKHRLKSLGYDQSEIVRFELSEYFTVCAGKFLDQSEARSTANQIEDKHSIDTYVRIAN